MAQQQPFPDCLVTVKPSTITENQMDALVDRIFGDINQSHNRAQVTMKSNTTDYRNNTKTFEFNKRIKPLFIIKWREGVTLNGTKYRFE